MFTCVYTYTFLYRTFFSHLKQYVSLTAFHREINNLCIVIGLIKIWCSENCRSVFFHWGLKFPGGAERLNLLYPHLVISCADSDYSSKPSTSMILLISYYIVNNDNGRYIIICTVCCAWQKVIFIDKTSSCSKCTTNLHIM